MAEELGLRAEFSADAQAYIRAIDNAIDANQRFGKSVGLTSTEIDKQDKKLNQARTAVTGATGETDKAAKAQRGFAQSVRDSDGNLSRYRYALYDVASTYAAVSAAALAAASSGAVFATKYESAFTEIERTTLQANGQVSSNIEGLRQDFLDLSEQIPLAYQELTKIGSLGAQLGIAEADLIDFTETVSQFARVSGVSAEESALAFGRIGELLNVPATEYRNLGSAIAYVATESAATDAQIISLTKELAAGAAGAGFTAAEVVGLGGALASLGVAPERARGALDTYFGTLNKAVAEGGEKLENFAIITGTTAEQLEALVRAGEGEQVLQRFIQGLAQIDNIQITQALDELGLSQLRVENTFRRLGQNAEFVAENLRNAEGAYASGTFLGDAFAVVLNDVASQFQLLQNSIGRFLATAGAPVLEFLRVALPVAAAFVGALADFAATGSGQVFFGIATALLAIVGAYTALRAIIALTTASTYALIVAQGLATGSGIRGAIAQLTGAMLSFKGATDASTVAMGANSAAASTMAGRLAALAKSTLIIAAVATSIQVLTDAVYNEGRGINGVLSDLTGGFEQWGSSVLRSTGMTADGVSEHMARMRIAGEQLMAFLLGGPVAGFAQMANQAKSGRLFGGANFTGGGRTRKPGGRPGSLRDGPAGLDALKALDAQARATIEARKQMERLGSSAEQVLGGGSGGGGGGGGTIPRGAEAAAREIRTLVDYASDLSGVFSRAFDIRFGSQLAVDEIANQWDTLSDRIRQAGIELQGLTADRNIKEYFLTVADAYGDELRAGKLRAEIADINEKIADTQADASTELTGNSKAARNNRKTLTDLAKGYENYIVQLAESGADQATLNAAVERSEAEFRAQALALGYSNAQLQPYIQSFRGLTTVINNVPRNITVTANINPALQALNEFAARAEQAGRNGATGFGRGFAAGGGVSAGLPSTAGFYNSGLNAGKSFRDGFVTYINREGGISFYDPKTGTKSPISIKAFSGGGYTGSGGKYEPAGIVHRGEYVVQKSDVNQRTGLPYADAMGGLKSGSRPASNGYAGGGFVSGGGIVELGPKSLQTIRSIARQEVVLAVNDREIARASASGSKKITQEGGRL